MWEPKYSFCRKLVLFLQKYRTSLKLSNPARNSSKLSKPVRRIQLSFIRIKFHQLHWNERENKPTEKERRTSGCRFSWNNQIARLNEVRELWLKFLAFTGRALIWARAALDCIIGIRTVSSGTETVYLGHGRLTISMSYLGYWLPLERSCIHRCRCSQHNISSRLGRTAGNSFVQAFVARNSDVYF